MILRDNHFADTVGMFVARYSLLRGDGSPVIVGLSGGADSVALLAVLKMLGFNLLAVHCNFHLRGEESDRDMKFAESVAARYGVPILTEHIDIPGWRKIHSGSVEMACRDTRYQLFERIRKEKGAQAIAVAHHREDNLETVVQNMMRGTGIAGMTGMAPVSENHVVRPLLIVSRRQIEDFLTSINQDYVVDSTNLQNDYARNRVRNIVTPALLQANPNAIDGITVTIGRLRETEVFYRRAMREVFARYCTRGGIDLNALANDPDAELILFENLRAEGVSRQMAADMITSRSSSGRRFMTGSCEWINDYGYLRRCEQVCAADGNPFVIERIERKNMIPVADASVAYLDVSALDAGLTWRYWREGDRMRPYGMKGSKKVSDLMHDAHVPVDRKKAIPLLVTDDDSILFIPGVRASALFPVRADSATILRVKLNG